MVRLAVCTECGVTAACWGHEPRCIAHLDDGDERKLTDEQVLSLRAERAAGDSYAVLAARYGIAESTAWAADHGVRYAEVA